MLEADTCPQTYLADQMEGVSGQALEAVAGEALERVLVLERVRVRAQARGTSPLMACLLPKLRGLLYIFYFLLEPVLKPDPYPAL